MDGNELGTVHMVVGVSEFVLQVTFYISLYFYCAVLVKGQLLTGDLANLHPQYALHTMHAYNFIECFLLLMQLSVFPLIVRCVGYRWTLRLGLVLFAVSCVLLPFSNQITGPIPNTSALNASLSYSGSGSGSGFQNSTTFDYCENDLSDEMHANINSVIRIPIYVWVVVVITLLVMMVSRYVHQL